MPSGFNVTDATLNFAINSTDAVRAIESLDALAKQAKVTSDAQQQFSMVTDQLGDTLKKLATTSQLVANQMQVMMQQQTDQIRLLQSQVWTYTGLLDMMTDKARNAYDALRAVSSQIGTPLIGAERFLAGTNLPVYTPAAAQPTVALGSNALAPPAAGGAAPASSSTSPTTSGIDSLAQINASIASVASFLGPLEGTVKLVGGMIASMMVTPQHIPAYGVGMDDATQAQVLSRLTAGISDRSLGGAGSQIRGAAGQVGVDLSKFQPNQQLEAFKAINDELNKMADGWDKARIAEAIYGSYSREVQDAIIRGTREVSVAEQVAMQERQRLMDADRARERAELQQQVNAQNGAAQSQARADNDAFSQSNALSQIGTALSPIWNRITAGPRFLLGGESAGNISKSMEPTPGAVGIMQSLGNFLTNRLLDQSEQLNASQPGGPDQGLYDSILAKRQEMGLLPRTGQQGPYPPATLSRPDLFGDSTNQLLRDFSAKTGPQSAQGVEDLMTKARGLQENYFDFSAEKQKQLWDLIYNYATGKNTDLFDKLKDLNKQYTVSAAQEARSRADTEAFFQRALVAADPVATAALAQAQATQAHAMASGAQPNTFGYSTFDATRLGEQAQLANRSASVFTIQQQIQALESRLAMLPQQQALSGQGYGAQQPGATAEDQLKRETDLTKDEYGVRRKIIDEYYEESIARGSNAGAAEAKRIQDIAKLDIDTLDKRRQAQLEYISTVAQGIQDRQKAETDLADQLMSSNLQTQQEIMSAGQGAGLFSQRDMLEQRRAAAGFQLQQSSRAATGIDSQIEAEQARQPLLDANQLTRSNQLIENLTREAAARRLVADTAYEGTMRTIEVQERLIGQQGRLSQVMESSLGVLQDKYRAMFPPELQELADKLARTEQQVIVDRGGARSLPGGGYLGPIPTLPAPVLAPSMAKPGDEPGALLAASAALKAEPPWRSGISDSLDKFVTQATGAAHEISDIFVKFAVDMKDAYAKWSTPKEAPLMMAPPRVGIGGLFADAESQYPNVPPGTLGALMSVESSGVAQPGKPVGASGQQAQGFFQWMKSTAEQYGVVPGEMASEAQGAAHYISDLLVKFSGDLTHALSAYGGFVTKDPSGYVSAVTSRLPGGANQSAAQAAINRAQGAASTVSPTMGPAYSEVEVQNAKNMAIALDQVTRDLLAQHNVAEQTDADQKRLADAYLHGSKAVEDMNIQLKAEALNRKLVALNDPNASDKVAAFTADANRASDTARLTTANQMLHAGEQQQKLDEYALSIATLSTEKQSQLLELKQKQLEIEDKGLPNGDLILGQAQKRLALEQQIADVKREQGRVDSIFQSAFSGIENSFTTFFENIGQKGKHAFADLGISIVQEMDQAMSKLTTEMFIRPLMGSAISAFFGPDYARTMGYGGVGIGGAASGAVNPLGGLFGGGGLGGLLGGGGGGGAPSPYYGGYNAPAPTGAVNPYTAMSLATAGAGTGSPYGGNNVTGGLWGPMGLFGSNPTQQGSLFGSSPYNVPGVGGAPAQAFGVMPGSAAGVTGGGMFGGGGLFGGLFNNITNPQPGSFFNPNQTWLQSQVGVGSWGILGDWMGIGNNNYPGAGGFPGAASLNQYTAPWFSGASAGAPTLLDMMPTDFHSGGVAGRDQKYHYGVDPSVFMAAHRYHFGGLMGDEVPAILQTGERVLSRSQNRDYENTSNKRGPVHVQMTVVTQDAESFRRSKDQTIAQTMYAVDKANKRYR